MAVVAALAMVLLTVAVPGVWSVQAANHSTATARETPTATATATPAAAATAEAHPAARTTDPRTSGGPSATPPQQAAPDEPNALDEGSPPLHITYAVVGLDQAILPLAPTAAERELGSIVPPHTQDAYWLRTYGMPGAGSVNTTYLVGHSWEGRASPFNNISTSAEAGDLLTVITAEGPLDFRVDGVTTEYKDTLRDSKIWDRVPGRLILITCYTADLWGKNIIVQASPVPKW